MPLIRQMVKGNFRSNDVVATEADLQVIIGMLEGEITTYEERSSGGTDVPTPSEFRVYKLGVNRKIDNLSCTVNIPHVKPGKEFPDMLAQIALFDADFESASPATGMRLVYGGKR
jgi:hypothetical protein